MTEPTDDRVSQESSAEEPATKPARTTLDDEKRRQIVAILANGSSRRVAARYVGCAPSTITRTAQRDPEFARQLAQAEQSVEIEALRAIRRAARGERFWRAAAWLLEHRNPEDFGRNRPGAFSAQQVLQVLVQVLATLGSDLSDASRQRAVEKAGTLLMEFDEAGR